MNYYEILNVAPTSEDIVIRAAYRALMSKYHPDKYAGSRAEADRMSRLINEAHRTLSDLSKRAAYDAKLAREAAAGSSAAGTQRANTGRNPPPPPPPPPSPRPQRAEGLVTAVYPPRTAGDGFRHLWLVVAAPLLALFIVMEKGSGEAVSADVNAATDLTTVDPGGSGNSSPDSAIVPPAELVSLAPPAIAAADTTGGNGISDQQMLDDLATLEGNETPEADHRRNQIAKAYASRRGLTASEAVLDLEKALASRGSRSGAGDQRPPSGGTNARPDLSRMSREDRATIELACIAEVGIVAKNGCLREQAASLTPANARPDLSRLSREDRSTIELACIAESGIVAKNRCLREQARSLTPENARPDLSRISREDRSTIELACIAESGIENKNRCLQAQLRALLSH